MDILSVSNPKSLKIPTFCSPKTLNPKTPSNHKIPTYPFHRNPFPHYLSASTTRKFQTLAHFGRPTNRRNSLRKKLLHDLQVRLPNHIPTDPSSVSSNVVEESDAGFQRLSVDYDSLVEFEKPKSKLLGESVLLNKLENWVDQYRNDIEYWGIGSGPIFTVYQDSVGVAKKVLVDEDEILRRSRVQRDVIEDFPEVKDKILDANNLAKEMESGNNVIARNSSVAKFVVQGEVEEEGGGFVNAVCGFVVQPGLLPKLSGVGGKVLCVLVALWAVKKLFSFGDKKVEYTEVQKKMMMRKIRARKEKEMLVKGAVEVIPKPLDTPAVDIKKPKLDKEQLKNNILKAKGVADKLVVQNSSADVRTGSTDMDNKVREIRDMARLAREIEGRNGSLVSRDVDMNDPAIGKSSNENEVKNKDSKQDNSLRDHKKEVARNETDDDEILPTTSVDATENVDNLILQEVVPADDCNLYALDVIVPREREINEQEIEIDENVVPLKDGEDNKYANPPINGSFMTSKSSVNKRPRIILSVKEARDYLSKKHDKQDTDTESEIELMQENIVDFKSPTVDFNDHKCQHLEMNTTVSRSNTLNGISDPNPKIIASEDSKQKDRKLITPKNECTKDSGAKAGLEDLQKSETTLDSEVNGIGTEASLSEEKRLLEIEPKIKQIRSDALNGIADSMPSINPSEDSDQKDKEFGPTKIDYFKNSDVEPEVGDHQKFETTSDSEVNGIGTEADLSAEKSLHGVDRIIKKIRSDALNGISDTKPATSPSEDSDQKNKEFGPTKIDSIKDSDVEPVAEDRQISETTLNSEINGIGIVASLSSKKSLHDVEPIIKQIRSDALNGISDSKPIINPIEDSDQKDKDSGPTNIDYIKDSGVEQGVEDCQKFSSKAKLSGKKENWLEHNFHEVEPIIKQIRAGFRDNYMVAKERVDQPLDIPTEMESLGVVEDGGELDWMQNDNLRDIVFRVRDNELSGRDPFYLMNNEDKEAFFRGLEKKVERENKKLSHLHEWLHSNIENLDYGQDGISIYDPLEKIIPRWKGPPVEKIPEFLNEFLDKRKTASTSNLNPVKKDKNNSAKESADSSLQVDRSDGSTAPITKPKNPKTVIEGSDGSVKAGKKSGKEYWHHTKKWSQGFLDSYNAETDPEVKSIMKDMGKDLDRWITEKEIEEAADVMNRLPDENRSFVDKKISKLKREMEMFGPQAVVSKYREYADDKEEDYLWWLDLPYVLCLELYTIEDGEQRVGFYSLEMAEDLELEPKPYHVIAFQDPGDCKNLCYIIQAHMDMLGNGNAFVVAQRPKEAFREAKANGFGVTVIKKGELELNIDQTLEEVEEQIIEIGSKMYHDKMMKERSVDVNSIMKGVFGFNDRSTKRLKRKLKKPRS